MSDESWSRRLQAIGEITARGERAWWRRQAFHKPGPYKPTTPKFHIYVKRYWLNGTGQTRWVGLCGYGYNFAEAIDEHPFTRLKDPGKGKQCSKCRKRAEM